MRKTLWAVVVVLVLAAGTWLGARVAWQLHEAVVKRGCVPLFADIADPAIMPAAPERLRFAALGDTGTGSAGARRVAEALRTVCGRDGCDFVALLGDNFYPSGVAGPGDPLFQTAFESVYAGLPGPVVPILGNHDVKRPVVAQVFHTRESTLWRMPNFEYTFQAGPARFFAINTNCQPLGWWHLEEELDAQPPTADAPWTFVLGHHALYSQGPHGDANWAVRWFWEPLRPRVDYYLAGHNHLLEHLQRSGEDTDYVVSGSGGADVADPARAQPDSAARSRFRRYAPGFAWFDVTATRVILRFYDDAGTLLYEHRRSRPAS